MHSGILYSLGQSLREILTSLIGVPILVDLLMTVICATILLLIMATSALVFTLGERKICAFIQVRIGPNRVGPGGLLQSVADMLKLMDKEDIVPRGIDKWLWVLSPILLLVP